MSDDEHLSFALLAVCDALEQQDDTKARESLTRARKHAHRVLDRGKRKEPETITPAAPEEGEPQ